jgi:hypothetical protein
MRILLDENVDRRLVLEFGSVHRVKTVSDEGWSGIGNGDLVRAAAQQFDVLVTMDRNLPYQLKLADFDLAVIIIAATSNRLAVVTSAVPEILQAIEEVGPGEWRVVRATG